jgi:hypothetical protein
MGTCGGDSGRPVPVFTIRVLAVVSQDGVVPPPWPAVDGNGIRHPHPKSAVGRVPPLEDPGEPSIFVLDPHPVAVRKVRHRRNLDLNGSTRAENSILNAAEGRDSDPLTLSSAPTMSSVRPWD